MEAALNSDIDRLLDRRDAPIKWVCDDDVSDCTRCASSFGLFNRKVTQQPLFPVPNKLTVALAASL